MGYESVIDEPFLGILMSRPTRCRSTQAMKSSAWPCARTESKFKARASKLELLTIRSCTSLLPRWIDGVAKSCCRYQAPTPRPILGPLVPSMKSPGPNKYMGPRTKTKQLYTIFDIHTCHTIPYFNHPTSIRFIPNSTLIREYCQTRF